MAKNGARAAVPAPVVAPAAPASAPNVTPAADNGAAKGAPAIATGPQLPTTPDPGVASQNRVDVARSKLIAEASKTIKLDVSKAPEAPKSEAKPEKTAEEPAKEPEAAAGTTEAKLIAQIARLNKQLREEKARAKPPAPVATPPELANDAAAMKALREAAKKDPYAVFQELEKAGMPYDKLLETFVSQKPGDSPGKATTAEANAALDALKKEIDDLKAERTKEKDDAAQREAQERAKAIDTGLIDATKALIEGDKSRWELCSREPEAVRTAIAEGRKVVKALGRDVSDDEGKEIMEAALDALEEHYTELGKRYSKAPPAPPPRRIAATISRELSGSRPSENGQSKRLDVNEARRAAIEAAKGVRLTIT